MIQKAKLLQILCSVKLARQIKGLVTANVHKFDFTGTLLPIILHGWRMTLKEKVCRCALAPGPWAPGRL